MTLPPSQQIDLTFEINNFDDRQNMIRAFANSGYKVWCTDTMQLLDSRYFVHVEYANKPDGEVKK